MDFDKAQVAGGIPAQGGDVFGAQAGMGHRVSHADAVRVFLVQPFEPEAADQGARAQEGGAVALAFLFRETDDFQVVRQALAAPVQFAHAGHWHEDAQPPVVLAGVAHRVVVAARQQGGGIGAVGQVPAHHVAHGVDADLVEAALAHPLRQQLCAGAVRVGQVGDGQQAFFRIARVAVDGKLFPPVPDIVAQGGGVAELVLQAELGDAVEVMQRFLEFDVGRVVQAALEFVEHLPERQPGSARAAYGQDEGEAEFGAVDGIQLAQAGKFGRRSLRQAGQILFADRCFAERRALLRGGGQLGMGAHERKPGVGVRFVHRLTHALPQVGQGAERAGLQRPAGDPGRTLV
ncbi:hypothetical protein FQZ97_676210 [compost metagenome]